MSVSLDKHESAVIPFGDLILRGKIVKRYAHSITVKVQSCQGRDTREEYPIMVGQTHRFMITEACDLYR